MQTTYTPALGHDYTMNGYTRCGKNMISDHREHFPYLEHATASFSNGNSYWWSLNSENYTLEPFNRSKPGTTAETTITINVQQSGTLYFEWSCFEDIGWGYHDEEGNYIPIIESSGTLTVLLDGQEIVNSDETENFEDYYYGNMPAGEHRLTLRYTCDEGTAWSDVCIWALRLLTDCTMGDVNTNGQVNIVDAQLAYDIALGGLRENANFSRLYAYADVACGGTVDAADAFAIQHLVMRGLLN